MPLLLQLNGDQPSAFPGHTRRLYIFGCRNKACARKPGSVRCIRASVTDPALAAQERVREEERRREDEARKAAEDERKKAQGQLGSALFGGPTPAEAGRNPFAANPFAAAGAAAANNPFASPAAGLAAKPPQQPAAGLAETFAQKASIADAGAEKKTTAPTTTKTKTPYEPWPTDPAQLPKPYPSYHLDADYETLAPEDPTALPANARLDPDMEEPAEESSGGKGGGGKEDKETFESLMDRAFQRFADRLAQNPEQVLRYEWRGQPLLYSAQDRVGKLLGVADEEDEGVESGGKVRTSGGTPQGMPRCGNCGAERVFEVQLTPQAIVELEAEEMSLEGMEWGTIVVGVCARDCAEGGVEEGEVTYLEEWVGVQWEEVTQRK